MTRLEDVFLDRYFLEPGARGPVASVHVDDDDLLVIFNVGSIEEAEEAFKAYLPTPEQFRDAITTPGSIMLGRHPRYLPILIYLCWMQTSATRRDDEQQFHEMLTRRFGASFVGRSFKALNEMWEHLKRLLARDYRVELVLQQPAQFDKWVGMTRRISFPTWRDLSRLNDVRDGLLPTVLLDPRHVARAVDLRSGFDAYTALDYSYRVFKEALKAGGREYYDTPFWRAWVRVISKTKRLERLEIREGDYGELELFLISPFETRQRISSPEDAVGHLPDGVGRAINKGFLLLEQDLDGSWQAIERGHKGFVLVKKKHLDTINGVKHFLRVNKTWWLAAVTVEGGGPAPLRRAAREFGWHDGVPIGRSFYLGRSPLAPLFSADGNGSDLTVTVAGSRVQVTATVDGFQIPEGVHEGEAVGCQGARSNRVNLLPMAVEHISESVVTLDRSVHISDDLENFDSAPVSSASPIPYDGQRFLPCHNMVTLGEALYARSARSLSFKDTFGLIRRILKTHGGPDDWTVLRAFIDAGWFDTVVNRAYPSRSIVQRQLAAIQVGEQDLLIQGPTPLSVIDRLEAVGRASGVIVEVIGGVSEWSLPRTTARSTDAEALREFTTRANLLDPRQYRAAVPLLGNRDGFNGYYVVRKLDLDKGWFNFDTSAEPVDGVYRLERTSGKSPPIYASAIPGKPMETFTSPPIAILAHHCRRGSVPFKFDGRLLKPTLRRASLPAAWARWAADRSSANPGPAREGETWTYFYPVSPADCRELGKLVPIHGLSRQLRRTWADTSASSASTRGRRIFDPNTRSLKGRVRPSGKQ